ncbi:hypothetical protein Fmac_001304 [Flemingia macrophylla]|uniref:K+ potassium transporter integral membrane domain-containing protein n=1 Tax=Flemingia macrophylla TaxID=520843 RepID=A0ABD1NGR5_9FABA
MLITTILVSLIMLTVWKKSVWVVALLLPVGLVELLYLSSQMTKFMKGGFVPILLAFFLTIFMGIWHYVQKERCMFELKNKVSTEYGYRDVLEDHVAFESQLVHQLKEFVRLESFMLEAEGTGEQALTVENETYMEITINATDEDAIVEYRAPSYSTQEPEVTGEIEFIEEQREHGVIYMLGEAEVVASPRASIFNKVVVNYAYNFLRKNFLEGDRSMPIPPNKFLKVGMVYEI